MAVNKERKRATVKLIPRIDLQALTEKYVMKFVLYPLYEFLDLVILIKNFVRIVFVAFNFHVKLMVY